MSLAANEDIMELTLEGKLDEHMLATFTLACVSIDDAMRMLHEAVVFCRQQTGLYGERAFTNIGEMVEAQNAMHVTFTFEIILTQCAYAGRRTRLT